MSDATDRAAEVIAPIIANATACGYDPKGTCGTCRADSALIAKALADAGLLATPEYDAEVAARALREAAEVFDGGLPRRGIDDSWREAGTNYIRALRERADRIEREAGL